jgi:hypothetical protein
VNFSATIQSLINTDAGRQRLFTAVVLSCAFFATAIPLLSAAWLPFVDYPQHLGTVAAMAGQGNPIWAHFFDVELGRVQYLAFYLLAELLALPFGVELGTRLAVVVGLSSLPLAVAAFMRAHDRNVLGAALSSAIALNIFVFWGFLNYCVAFSAALFSLAALARLIKVPSWKNMSLYGALVLICFYAHAQIYGWVAVASLIQVLAAGPRLGLKGTWKVTWRAMVAAIPSVVGMLYWLLNSRLVQQGMAGLRGTAANVVADRGVEFETIAQTVRGWLSHSFGFYHDGGGENIAVFMLAAAVLLVAVRGFQTNGKDSENAHGWAPELIFGLALACYLFLPKSFKLISPINHRFLPLVLALIPVLGPKTLAGWRPRLIVGTVMMALCLYVAQTHLSHFAQSDQEMGDLDTALSHTKPGKRVLGLIYDTGSKVTTLPTYLHSHQYYQAKIGGYAAFGFVEFPISPLVYRQGVAPPPFAVRFEWTPRLHPKRYRKFEHYFDYYLLRVRAGGNAPRFYPLGIQSKPKLLYSSERWKLYARAP